MNWYDLDDTARYSDMTPEALRQRAQAYHDALLASPGRRAVFMDIMRFALRYETCGDDAVYGMAMRDLIDEIKKRCGINDPLAVLEREAEVSARFEPEAQTKAHDDLLEPKK